MSQLNDDEMRDEYDFSQMQGGIRGKYAEQYHEGVKLVMLEPDVAEIFSDAKEVNDALRMLGKLIQHHAELKNKTL